VVRSASAIPTLLVQGDDRPGLGHAIAEAMADANINLAFLVAQVVDRRFSAVIGFENAAAVRRATAIIKKAVKSVEK
jgi:predicted amino acid-binding ACT domain protein